MVYKNSLNFFILYKKKYGHKKNIEKKYIFKTLRFQNVKK